MTKSWRAATQRPVSCARRIVRAEFCAQKVTRKRTACVGRWALCSSDDGTLCRASRLRATQLSLEPRANLNPVLVRFQEAASCDARSGVFSSEAASTSRKITKKDIQVRTDLRTCVMQYKRRGRATRTSHSRAPIRRKASSFAAFPGNRQTSFGSSCFTNFEFAGFSHSAGLGHSMLLESRSTSQNNVSPIVSIVILIILIDSRCCLLGLRSVVNSL